jgi:hypothetical protein
MVVELRKIEESHAGRWCERRTAPRPVTGAAAGIGPATETT